MRDPTQKPAPPANSANRAARVVACPAPPLSLQVLLDEARIEVNVDLYQWRITDCLEAMNLTGLDDKDVSRAALEGLAVDGPHSAAFTDELDLVIRVPVRTRSRTGLPMEQEHRNTGVALLRSNKLMRTTNKWQILLAHVMYPLRPSCLDWMSLATTSPLATSSSPIKSQRRHPLKYQMPKGAPPNSKACPTRPSFTEASPH